MPIVIIPRNTARINVIRSGCAGTLFVQPFPPQAEADAAARLYRLKERKGYHDTAEHGTL